MCFLRWLPCGCQVQASVFGWATASPTLNLIEKSPCQAMAEGKSGEESGHKRCVCRFFIYMADFDTRLG